MSEAKPYFIHQKAKKQSGEPHAVFWETAKTESRALRDAENALEDAEKDPANYFKAVVTNFPVVNELPPEGVISFSFCDYYQLADDGMTWQLIPGVTLPAHPGEKVVDGTDTTIVDGVDTTTGEIVDEQALNEAGTLPENNPDLKIDEGDDENTRYPVVQMSFRKQLLSQLTSDALRYHLTQAEYHEIARLELNTDNGYVQNLILAATSVDKIKTLDMPFLWKYTKAVRDVFDMEKRHELALVLKFTQVWAETSHLDRGILTKEWAKGNRVSTINRTPSGANAGGGNVTDRKTPLTKTGLAFEIAAGLQARKDEFDIYNIPFRIECAINAIMNLSLGEDDPVQQEYVATCRLFEDMPGGMDYSRACNIATVKTTPLELYQSPFRHREHLNRVMTETDHAHPAEHVVDIACGRSSSPMPMAPLPEKASSAPELLREEVSCQLAAHRGEFVPGISDPNDPEWVHEDLSHTASNECEKTEVEITSDVQVQEINGNEEPASDALSQGEGANCACQETAVTSNAEILAAAAPHLADQNLADVNQNAESVSQKSESVNQIEPETAEIEPDVKPEWPASFEPGRYENVPNDVYHAANGISSTMLKDARISLMYFHGRHISKAIPRQQSDAFRFGNIVHSYVLEPEKFTDEFAVPAEMPKDVVSTTADLVSIIKEYNASLPALMTPEELKTWIDERNATQTPPLSLGNNAEETANLYMSLPEEFQRLPPDDKQTATQQKACIREYNASLPPMLKTSGTREQLLDQIATVRPEFAESERAKFVPYNTSGAKEQLTEIVRSIRPDVVTADDWHQLQEEACKGKTMISLDMYHQAQCINSALQADKDASWLLNHPDRKSEVSYFGFDEETGQEIRVRPDIEIRLPAYLDSICADLKTISVGYVPQDRLKARLHREIIERGYHISAAMYCDVAELDTFAWIFVNKDPGYHWVAVIYASAEMLELGRQEYRLLLRQINEATFTDNWPAPITGKYVDELNEYDINRLSALSGVKMEDLA